MTNGQKTRKGCVGFGFVFLVLWVWLMPSSVQSRDYRFTDAHLHYVNYVLQSQGFQNLFAEMDANRIERAVIFGLGYGISWPDIRAYRVRHYTDPRTGTDYTPPVYFTKAGDFRLLMDYGKLAPQLKARIYPFLQAIDVTDRNEIYYVRDMFMNHPELCGIGELMMRQGELNRLTPLMPTGNSVALSPILDFAAANRMPVIFHQNLGEEASGDPEEPADPIYLKEITDLLTRHPETVLIWAHAGLSRNLYVKDHLVLLRRLLAAHPTLYFDLSWIVVENSILRDIRGWADLIMDYPDRFMLGSDKLGSFRSRTAQRLPDDWSVLLSSHAADIGLGETMRRFTPLLREIDQRRDGQAVSDMIAFRNINWLLSLIRGGCKTGKPVTDPWRGGDPWRDARYARPVMSLKLTTGNILPISVHANYANLAEDFPTKYYSWKETHAYEGTAVQVTIPKGDQKIGVGLFAKPGFRHYLGTVEESKTINAEVQSLVLIESWEGAFRYRTSGKIFYPSGNWPEVPWWEVEAETPDMIDAARVPQGKRLLLYGEPYFQGSILRSIPATNGQFEELGDLAGKVQSFQFLPAEKMADVSR